MKKESENSPKKRTLVRNRMLYIKKTSERPARWCCFMIVVMLFAFGLASGVCNSAGNSPEVRVGSELDFPPYAFVDESGRPAGFSVELIKAVTDTMGLSIKISTGSWDTVWNALVAGQLDVLPIVAKLPERQRLVDFSLPHTQTYDAFFVRKGDPPIQNIAAARGKEIVVMRSDAAHHELLARNFQGNLILVDTIPEGLKLISSGKHNAFLCSKLIGTLSIKEHRLTGLTAGPTIPDYKRVFSFGVKKGGTELLEKLNQGLLIIKTNGEYDRIYDKWLTFDDPWRKVQKYLLPAVVTVIAIAVIAGFWLVTLRRLVNKRTRELAEKSEMLRHAYDDLEARVQERTAELAQANQLLQSEITDRKRAEEALSNSERKYRNIFENATEGIFQSTPEGRYITVNPAFARIGGYSSPDEMIETVTDIQKKMYVHQEDRARLLELLNKQDMINNFEAEIRRMDNAIIWISMNVRVIRDQGGKIILLEGTIEDITDRKLAEEKIKASLLEKETMLKEIHHRVKNNLQVISSLLNLQSGYVQDEQSRKIFQESQERVRTMAMIHTQLYQSADLSQVDFGGFIRDLAGRLQQSYGIAASPVEIHVNVSDVSLPIDTSIPCGLILNELVSNALKHAFPSTGVREQRSGVGEQEKEQKGEIAITLREEPTPPSVIASEAKQSRFLTQIAASSRHEEEAGLLAMTENGYGSPLSAPRFSLITLTVSDNGIGFPEGVDFRNTKSLGLELVNLLVGQINGTIDLQVEGGTTFTITFPAVSGEAS